MKRAHDPMTFIWRKVDTLLAKERKTPTTYCGSDKQCCPHSAGGVCFSQGHSLSRFQIDYILSMECVSLNKSSGEGEDHLLLGWVHLILWAGGRGPWSPLKCDCIHDHSLTGPKTRGKEAEHNLLKKKNGIAIEDTTKTC